MNVLEVQDLCKTYPGFRLDNVSFSVAPGSIMGFIGRNGAGKTTTLKSLLHIVHPDAGEIRFFGLDLNAHEREIKQRIGYAGGAVDFYKRKPIRVLADVTRGFYENWDEAAYKRYMEAFSLDENKSPWTPSRFCATRAWRSSFPPTSPRTWKSAPTTSATSPRGSCWPPRACRIS